jgi:alpha-amylase/alpha-mannosidase (GH57 family)
MSENFSVTMVGQLITQCEQTIQEVTTASKEMAQRSSPCGEHHSRKCELVNTVLRLAWADSRALLPFRAVPGHDARTGHLSWWGSAVARIERTAISRENRSQSARQ